MVTPTTRAALLAALCGAFLPSRGAGQVTTGSESLGQVRFEVSCAGEVQARFDRAVALLHHMTYSVARSEFSAIADAHPRCAMAHWGVAMTYFQPLWATRPSEEDLRHGREAVAMAARIVETTQRERMFIAATAAFFDPAITEYWERIAAWAQGMRDARDAFPEDVETRAFFALSQLATAPSSDDQSHHETAAAVLSDILATQPTHPGAVHYLIHANDAAGREGESLDEVRRYGTIAPRNAHALHMPTHIYVRLGDWPAVAEGNRQAAAAALETPAGDRKQWIWDEFPHAVEYLVYALLQVGDDRAALDQVTELSRTRNLQPGFKSAFHLASVPARYALERRDWRQATALEPRADTTVAWDRFPWPEAVSWFARGIGAARSGEAPAAREAEARLAQLREASEKAGEELFALQTEILRLGVAAWLAATEGDREGAVSLMSEAVRLEQVTPKHPVTPAPTLPASELLGDLLLEQGRPAEALEAYQATLASVPGRFNSLVGAARSADRLGDAGLATTYYGELLKSVVADSPRPEVAEATDYLRRR
jgi:tetratricopeptide (TPR) repeat protein